MDLTQCSKYLGNEIIWADCCGQMISSIMGLHLAHIMNLIAGTAVQNFSQISFRVPEKIYFENVSQLHWRTRYKYGVRAKSITVAHQLTRTQGNIESCLELHKMKCALYNQCGLGLHTSKANLLNQNFRWLSG